MLRGMSPGQGERKKSGTTASKPILASLTLGQGTLVKWVLLLQDLLDHHLCHQGLGYVLFNFFFSALPFSSLRAFTWIEFFIKQLLSMNKHCAALKTLSFFLLHTALVDIYFLLAAWQQCWAESIAQGELCFFTAPAVPHTGWERCMSVLMGTAAPHVSNLFPPVFPRRQ